MLYINLAVLVRLGLCAFCQDVQFDYDRSADFDAYKTYQWVDYRAAQAGDQLLDQGIKRAVDAQLAGKGLRRVESDGDLLVAYQAGISEEKKVDSLGREGPYAWVPWGDWGNTRVASTTIEVGKVSIGLFDPATKLLVCRGSASKTLTIKRDPDKNYHNLEKAMAKLFRNYPLRAGKG